MPHESALSRIASESPFIFIGAIKRTGATTMSVLPVTTETVVVGVEEVIKAPPGFQDFAGSEVTVQLRQALPLDKYVFFAAPWAVGGGLAVREQSHLNARAASIRGEVVAALETAFEGLVGTRVASALMAVLGSITETRRLSTASEEDEEDASWSTGDLRIEKTLKGDRNIRSIKLLFPSVPNKNMPRTPVLRAGARAIYLARQLPQNATDLIKADGSRDLFFVEDTSDILPPERLETVTNIARRLQP